MKKIPNTWANKEIELILNKEFLKWDYRKKALAKKFGINNNKAAKTNLAQVTIPEVFSSEISILSENLDLRDDAATLQAFQTYRISLYDTLDDKHMYKCGKPTFLKLYGKKKMMVLWKKYDSMVALLSHNLEERGVENAKIFSEKQYKETIEADQIRNLENEKMKSIDEAIQINERLTSGHAKYIAKLTKGGTELENAVSSLVNAMAITEDFIDFISMEDFKKIKATIPLAIINEENGPIDKNTKIEDIINNANVVERTKEYINNALNKYDKIIGKYNQKGYIFTKLSKRLRTFLEHFPEDYLK